MRGVHCAPKDRKGREYLNRRGFPIAQPLFVSLKKGHDLAETNLILYDRWVAVSAAGPSAQTRLRFRRWMDRCGDGNLKFGVT